jgi:hypothetical protein
MVNPYFLEMEARMRQEEALQAAARARLCRLAARGRKTRPEARPARRRLRLLGAALSLWLGIRLVRWGYRLMALSPCPAGPGRPARRREGVPPARPRHGTSRAACRPQTLRRLRGPLLLGG